MDPNHNNLNLNLTRHKTHTPTPAATHLPHRRRLIHFRRRKLPSVRLGGKKAWRGHLFVRLYRRARLRWLKIKNACTLKKLTQYYRCLIREIIEASAALETVHMQQRVLFDPTSGVPVLLGMPLNTYTPAYGP